MTRIFVLIPLIPALFSQMALAAPVGAGGMSRSAPVRSGSNTNVQPGSQAPKVRTGVSQSRAQVQKPKTGKGPVTPDNLKPSTTTFETADHGNMVIKISPVNKPVAADTAVKVANGQNPNNGVNSLPKTNQAPKQGKETVLPDGTRVIVHDKNNIEVIKPAKPLDASANKPTTQDVTKKSTPLKNGEKLDLEKYVHVDPITGLPAKARERGIPRWKFEENQANGVVIPPQTFWQKVKGFFGGNQQDLAVINI